MTTGYPTLGRRRHVCGGIGNGKRLCRNISKCLGTKKGQVRWKSRTWSKEFFGLFPIGWVDKGPCDLCKDHVVILINPIVRIIDHVLDATLQVRHCSLNAKGPQWSTAVGRVVLLWRRHFMTQGHADETGNTVWKLGTFALFTRLIAVDWILQ